MKTLAIREMPLWPDAPFKDQVPKGLDIRKSRDVTGRELVVVSNQAHRAYSFPLELVLDNVLPGFYLERLKSL